MLYYRVSYNTLKCVILQTYTITNYLCSEFILVSSITLDCIPMNTGDFQVREGKDIIINFLSTSVIFGVCSDDE